MKKTKMLENVTRAIHKSGFMLKKHSPEILIISGVIGVGASFVMACKASTKLNDILDEAKENLETIHDVMEHPEKVTKEENGEVIVTYTEDDGKRDLAITYAQTSLKLVKLYGPSVLLGALSLTAIITSNNILRQRNVALAAAYATVDKGFKEYRGRVVERFGESIDRELRYNIKAKEVEELVVDENGEEKIVKTTVEVADPNALSPYARFFDEACSGWTKDPNYNLMFLRNQQTYANEKLKTHGYLFLNDVYEMLDIPKTKEGQIVGWIYDEKHPIGDNFVDFGIYDDKTHPSRRLFVNGHERNILLDFNVDGNILNLM